LSAAQTAITPPYPSAVAEPNPMIGPETIAPTRRVFVSRAEASPGRGMT
jgi:hypothetical protein